MFDEYYDSDEEAIYQKLVEICTQKEDKKEDKKESYCNKLFYFIFGKK